MATTSPTAPLLIQRQRIGSSARNIDDSACTTSENATYRVMKWHEPPPRLLSAAPAAAFSKKQLSNRRRWLKHGLWFAVTMLIALQTVSFLKSQQQQQSQQQWTIQPPVKLNKERKYPKIVSLSESISASHFFVRQRGRGGRDMGGFFYYLPPLQRMLGKPDYGGLSFHSLLLMPEHSFQRTVRDDDWYYYHYEHKDIIKAMDKIARRDDKADPYDDIIADDRKTCTPQKWAYEITQNCNSIHETVVFESQSSSRRQDYQFYEFEHLSNGHYRDTFLFSPVFSNTLDDTDIVVKEFRYARDFTRYNMQNVHREALILEKLSGSKRITKIYGHCGTTVLIERGWELTYQMVPRIEGSKLSRGRISQEDLDVLEKEEDDHVHPMNNFTIEEKLDIAIALTEGVAELHGYKEGVIAHDDISIDQWMLSAEGKVIFTDFNNCVPMEWDFAKNSYCKFWASYPGTFKAPEVYGGDHMVTEQVDIWPVGNLIFVLLTGLKPYYEETEEEVIQDLALKGMHPYLNPRYRTRSYIEGRMVQIMEQCHKRNPEDRVDIFEVVKFLRATKERHEKMKQKADKKQ